MDDRIQQLLDAGMVIKLTQQNLAALEALTPAQVAELVAIATSLVQGNATLVFTDFPSIQPPFTNS